MSDSIYSDHTETRALLLQETHIIFDIYHNVLALLQFCCVYKYIPYLVSVSKNRVDEALKFEHNHSLLR